MSSGSFLSNSRGRFFTKHGGDYDYQKLESAEDGGLSVDAEVQNAATTRVYVFGNSKVVEANETETAEMCELRTRGGNKEHRRGFISTTSTDDSSAEPKYLERELAESDTLPSLALQYGCPVAELKRINNIYRDQELFARKKVRVPLKRFGLLTELVQHENQNGEPGQPKLRLPGQGSETNTFCDDHLESDSDSDTIFVRTVSIRDACSSQSREAKSFLKNMDRDLEKIRNATKSQKDSLEEVTSTLTCKSIQPLPRKTLLSGIFNETDCGMRLCNIIAFVIVIALVTPLLYFIYYEYVKTV